MKNQSFAVIALIAPLALGLSACHDKSTNSTVGQVTSSSQTNNQSNNGGSSSNSGNNTNSVNPSDSNKVAPAGLGKTPAQRGGNYYEILGKATFDKICDISAGGYNYTGVINGAGQVGPACAKAIEKHKRVDPVDDPAGFSYNAKASIPYISEPGKAYNGYFYNRSHMISASLGGDPHAKNLITGTRMQNVGEKNSGGMRYTEKQAEKYVESPTAKSCPLTYEVTPHYNNNTDAVPTWVEVNMQSCDKKIDEKVAVFNDANGYTIDYKTGKWSKNVG